MRILIVTATAAEIAPLTAALERAPRTVDLLTTGVGMVATAVRVSRALTMADPYDLVLNLGVCGSFRRDLPPGAVVHVTSDLLPELGAEDDAAFLTIHDLGLLGEDEFPFTGGRLQNPSPPPNAALDRLPRVSGVTVNTVHGNEASIARLVERCRPDVESMEGAAFMYACLVHGVPFAQVRAVSNIVERRNRDGWRLGDAIRALADTALAIIDHA